MKNKNKKEKQIRYFIIAIIIFILSVVISCLANDILIRLSFSDTQLNVVGNLVNAIIAAIAVGLVLLQLKENKEEQSRQNDIQEATFILELNQTFIRDPCMAEIESLLENQAYYNKRDMIINEENRQKFVNYLAYFDGLAPLVLNGVLRLEFIDDLMAYRFYLGVNNKEVQEKELFKFPGDYRGCYKLYRLWTDYRKNKKLKEASGTCVRAL